MGPVGEQEGGLHQDNLQQAGRQASQGETIQFIVWQSRMRGELLRFDV